MEAQIKEIQLKCTICKKEFNEKRKFIRHLKVHSLEKPFACAKCNGRFKYRNELKRHEFIHVEEKVIVCEVCGMRFAAMGSLRKHLERHEGQKKYVCDVCDKGFVTNGDLITHRRMHSDERPHVCSVCKQAFKRKGNLSRHAKVHTGEKPYSCTVCGKGFARNTQLKDHLKVHTGEKPFKCTTCSKCFAKKYQLKDHQKVHTGEKPHRCTNCDETFVYPCQLRDHLAKHLIEQNGNKDEKPFSCDVCDKKFSKLTLLSQHKRCHSKKQYPCSHCTKNYINSSELNEHIDTKHSVGSSSLECKSSKDIKRNEVLRKVVCSSEILRGQIANEQVYHDGGDDEISIRLEGYCRTEIRTLTMSKKDDIDETEMDMKNEKDFRLENVIIDSAEENELGSNQVIASKDDIKQESDLNIFIKEGMFTEEKDIKEESGEAHTSVFLKNSLDSVFVECDAVDGDRVYEYSNEDIPDPLE